MNFSREVRRVKTWIRERRWNKRTIRKAGNEMSEEQDGKRGTDRSDQAPAERTDSGESDVRELPRQPPGIPQRHVTSRQRDERVRLILLLRGEFEKKHIAFKYSLSLAGPFRQLISFLQSHEEEPTAIYVTRADSRYCGESFLLWNLCLLKETFNALGAYNANSL